MTIDLGMHITPSQAHRVLCTHELAHFCSVELAQGLQQVPQVTPDTIEIL